jgi:hypothetical protein
MSAISLANNSCFGSGPEVSARLDGALTSRTNLTCFSGFQIASSGTEYEYNNAGTLTNSTTWLDKGSSGEVWVMWTRTSGTLSDWNNLGAGNNNVRLQCSTTRSFRLNRTSAGFSDIFGYCRFYDAATGGNLLQTTSTVEWQATYLFDGCPICCFPPGTMILMADGTEKPVEHVEVGDMMMIYDDGTQMLVPSPCSEVITREDVPMVRATFDDGSVLEMSIDHPLYINGAGPAAVFGTQYKGNDVIPLTVGMPVLTANHWQVTTIKSLELFNYSGKVFTFGNSPFVANGKVVY